MDVGEFIELLECDDDCPIVVEIDGEIRHINHVNLHSIPDGRKGAIIILEEDNE